MQLMGHKDIRMTLRYLKVTQSDLQREFQKLRRITNKCLPLARSDEHQRIVRDLADHLDRKIEGCRQMGG